MKAKTTVALGLLVGSMSIALAGYAEERGRARQAPPAFQAHPAGVHPRGATVRPRAIRSLAPKRVFHGRTGWTHWNHPEFERPSYYWDWTDVHNVTCVAEDSYGDQYPVSEAAAPGFGLNNMTEVEDDALDRCFNESGQDSTCVLASCTHV